ncbi:MAG: hypothetical protein FJ308_03310 [Planctomycetes bacterium]|nr:hypothetical protein [Planctomycetota bacterium]
MSFASPTLEESAGATLVTSIENITTEYGQHHVYRTPQQSPKTDGTSALGFRIETGIRIPEPCAPVHGSRLNPCIFSGLSPALPAVSQPDTTASCIQVGFHYANLNANSVPDKMLLLTNWFCGVLHWVTAIVPSWKEDSFAGFSTSPSTLNRFYGSRGGHQ